MIAFRAKELLGLARKKEEGSLGLIWVLLLRFVKTCGETFLWPSICIWNQSPK